MIEIKYHPNVVDEFENSIKYPIFIFKINSVLISYYDRLTEVKYNDVALFYIKGDQEYAIKLLAELKEKTYKKYKDCFELTEFGF